LKRYNRKADSLSDIQQLNSKQANGCPETLPINHQEGLKENHFICTDGRIQPTSVFFNLQAVFFFGIQMMLDFCDVNCVVLYSS